MTEIPAAFMSSGVPKPGQVVCVTHGFQWAYDSETKQPKATGMCGACLRELLSGEGVACGTHGIQIATPDGRCPVCVRLGVMPGELPPPFASELMPGFEDVAKRLDGEPAKPAVAAAPETPPPFDDPAPLPVDDAPPVEPSPQEKYVVGVDPALDSPDPPPTAEAAPYTGRLAKPGRRGAQAETK